MASLNPWARIISTAISNNTYTHSTHTERKIYIRKANIEGKREAGHTWHLRASLEVLYNTCASIYMYATHLVGILHMAFM
jgi:hypothetical protein